MNKVIFLMMFMLCIGACTSKEEKNKRVTEMDKATRERLYKLGENLKNDRLAADSVREEVEKIRLENERLDSISKMEIVKTIKKLSKHFIFKQDEFSKDDRVWVKPKDAPKYVNQNGMYCYFQTNNDKASNLRLKIQYAADDWLFIRYYIFSIDGVVFEYRPDNIDTDHGSTIWEWADNRVTSFDQSLINALIVAKSAKVRFVGRQYHKDRNISSQQLLSIKRTIQLYRTLGGIIN